VSFNTSFHVINSDNGLNSSEVYKAGQDSKGYMWFCTDAGVTRFDGYYFESFTVADGLVDNVVFDFYEDARGRIWFLSYNSLLCYFEKGVIYPYKYNDVIHTITQNNVASEKRLIVTEDETLYYSLRASGMLKISDSGILSNVHKKLNAVEIHEVDGQLMNSFQTGQFDIKNIEYPVHNLEKHKIAQYNPLNRIWYEPTISHWGDQGCILIQDKIISANTGELIYEGNGLTKFGILDEGRIWISGLNSLLVGEIENRKLTITDQYLVNEPISNLFVDHEGGIWVTSLNNGVYYSNGFFVKYTNQSLGLMNDNIVGLINHDNEVWTTHFAGAQNLSSGKKIISKSSAGYSRGVSAANQLAISTIDNTDITQEERITKFPFRTDFWANDKYIYSISARVYRYNLETRNVDTLYSGTEDHTGNSQNRFTSIADNNGQVFLGSVNGLYTLKRKNELAKFPDTINHLDYSISDIFYHPNWGVVASTSNNGILIYKGGELIETWNSKNGLISDNISCVYVGSNGQLFIGTNKGLQILDQNGAIRLLASNQGIQRQEVNCILPSTNEVWIGTTKGLYVADYGIFDLAKKKRETVELTQVLVDASEFSTAENNLQIPHSTNLIRLRFRTKSFTNWHSRQYQYRLTENDGWIDIESPEIVIARPKGNYSLQVRYLTANQVWSEAHSLLKMHVQIPFWKHWSFWSIFSLVFTVSMIFLIRRRQRKVEQLLRLKNEMLSLEQRVQAARMNPHFIFNVLNSIHSCLIFNENELAAEYLLKFSGLMRDLLKTAGESTIELNDEVRILTKYLEIEQLRQKGAFDFVIEAGNLNGDTNIPSMIVQPFVENAVIHGVSSNQNKGEIAVTFSQLDHQTILIEVEDNGEKTIDAIETVLNSGNNHAAGITKQRLSNYSSQNGSSHYSVNFKRTNDPDPCTRISIKVPIIES
jgi:ligand-binding sensor domain-containing protein